MKSYLTLLSIVLYCMAYTIVCYTLQTQTFERKHIALMTHLPLLVFSVALYASEYIGTNLFHDREIQKIGKVGILAFLIGYCLNSAGLISGITEKLFWFYAINLLGLIMILISSYRHGNFK